MNYTLLRNETKCQKNASRQTKTVSYHTVNAVMNLGSRLPVLMYSSFPLTCLLASVSSVVCNKKTNKVRLQLMYSNHTGVNRTEYYQIFLQGNKVGLRHAERKNKTKTHTQIIYSVHETVIYLAGTQSLASY